MSIADSIRQIALRGCEMYLCVCTVDAVDEQARTIDCTPIDEGAQLIGVNLQADQSGMVGIVSFPAVGSDVVVGFINPSVAVVLLTTELTKTALNIGNSEITAENNAVSIVTDKVNAAIYADTVSLDVNGTTLEMDHDNIVWNGGSETTANATNLKQELTKMSARIDGIINAITTSLVSANDGGATYKSNMTTALEPLQKEDFSQMIDDKIKH